MPANIYQRFEFEETITNFAPSEIIPVVSLRDIKDRIFTPGYAPEKSITVTIPAVGANGDCMVDTHMIPAGPPSDSAYLSCVRVSDSQAFTATKGSGSLTGFQMRVYPGLSWIDFHPDRAGDIVTITYKAGWSQASASLIRRLLSELNALETAFIPIYQGNQVGMPTISATASADIVKGTFCDVFLSGSTLKLRACTTGNPSGYANVAIPNGNVGNIIVSGLVTTFSEAGDLRNGTPSENSFLFASQKVNGAHTWAGDGNASYNLSSGQKEVVVGRYYGGNTAYILCNQYTRWLTE